MRQVSWMRPLLCPALVTLTACASSSGGNGGSGGAASARADCALTAADSAYLAGGPVYRDCAVDRRAHLVSAGQIQFRPMQPPISGSPCHHVQVELVVDSRGLPETATARMVSASLPELGRAVMESVPQWRFEPAQKDGQPVRQIVRQRQEFGFTRTVVSGRGSATPPRPPRC